MKGSSVNRDLANKLSKTRIKAKDRPEDCLQNKPNFTGASSKTPQSKEIKKRDGASELKKDVSSRKLSKSSLSRWQNGGKSAISYSSAGPSPRHSAKLESPFKAIIDEKKRRALNLERQKVAKYNEIASMRHKFMYGHLYDEIYDKRASLDLTLDSVIDPTRPTRPPVRPNACTGNIYSDRMAVWQWIQEGDVEEPEVNKALEQEEKKKW